MKNKLADLNNILFAQLERLDDENVTGEDLDAVIKRGEAIAGISAQIIANKNLQIKTVKTAHELGMHVEGKALLHLVEETKTNDA